MTVAHIKASAAAVHSQRHVTHSDSHLSQRPGQTGGIQQEKEEKLPHISDCFSLSEIMGCQRKWMFGWMTVTFTQERSAGLSRSFSSNTLSHTRRTPCD